MTLGEKIRELRQEKNVSQKELAESIGQTTADIAIWEADEAVPSVPVIAQLSAALGVTTDALILDSEIATIDPAPDAQEIVEEESKEDPESIKKPSGSKGQKKKVALVFFIAILLLMLLGGLAAFFIFFSTPSFSKNTEAIEKAASSLVKIYCYDYDGNASTIGSGFIAFNDQTVITNYHVIEDAYTCKISTDEDKSYDVAGLLTYSKEHDIAIIKLKKPTKLEALPLGNSDEIKKGETV
ncbi:MAG: helix-turn-helix domain-containing protein, partial [Clostridia bacterium]|nr:helix-turn-helix domain-containing protein [Clostridia bacterium]